MAVSGFDIGKAILEALGLPRETTYIEIRLGMEHPVEVLCTYYPSRDSMAAVVEVLKRYAVIEREGPPVPPDERQRRLRSRLDEGE